MCLISPLFGLPRNQKERMRGAGQIVSADVITLLLCKFYLCSVRCVSLSESSDLPFPPSLPLSYMDDLFLSVHACLLIRFSPLEWSLCFQSRAGGRGVGSVSSKLLTAAPAISLSHSSHSISHVSIYATHVYPFLPPRSVDGCPSLPIANHNVIFTYILR